MPDREALRRYHLALAGTVAFFASPLVSWWAALSLPAASGPTWKRRLVALAVLDTAVAACLLLVMLGGSEAKPIERPRIGVTMQLPEITGHVIVETVAPGSPADDAGVQPGDHVISVDDTPISTSSQLIELVGSTSPGGSRTLVLERGSGTLQITLAPIARLPPVPAPRRGLFDRDAERGATQLGWRSALPEAAIAGMLAGLCLLAWRRRVGVGPGLWALAALVVWALATHVAVFTLRFLGPSLGTFLLALLVASASLGLMGALGWWRLPKAPLPEAPMPALTAYGRGLFYCFAWSGRAAIVLGALAKRVGLPNHSASEAFGFSPSWGVSGVAMFMLAAVVVGPLAEELVFRGVLLPWLATWMSPGVAVAASAITFAVGHLYYGASVLLPLLYGVVFGWMRLRTGRLRAGVALHMTLNTLATVAAVWSTVPRH